MFVSRLKRRIPWKTAEGEDPSRHLVPAMDPAGSFSEAYRALRTNLLYAFVDSPPRVIAVTSPGRREGKTTTCANLGVVLAQVNKNALIVDCDLRAPTMHKIFGLQNTYGFVSTLIGERRLQDVCHEPLPGLKVLTAGPVPSNPAELLSSTRFAEFVDQARQQFDYVLFDTSPIQLVSDPAVVARHSDGVLLVLDAQNTRKVSTRQSVRSLEAVGARVLGTVLNNVKVPSQAHQRESYGDLPKS